jgi:hypothetical protein
VGTLTSCNPVGHSRPVTRLLYLFIHINKTIQTLKTEEVCNNGCISFYSNQSIINKMLKQQISSKGTVRIIYINFISLFTLKYLGRRNQYRGNILGLI